MLENLFDTIVLAQNGAAPAGNLTQLLFPGAIIAIMFIFMLYLPNKKRDKERRNMLAALKKNDHVVTIGGIKGIVANVKIDEDEVVLKIDEGTGAKMRVVLSSIARVIAADEDTAGEKKDSKDSVARATSNS